MKQQDNSNVIGKGMVLLVVLILVGCTELYKRFSPGIEHWIGEQFTRLAYEGRELSYNGFHQLVWSGIAAVMLGILALIIAAVIWVYKSYQTRRLHP